MVGVMGVRVDGRRRVGRWVAVVTVVSGVVALALAIVPGVVLDRPMPWMEWFGGKGAEEKPAKGEMKGLTVRYKTWSVTLGKKREELTAAEKAEEQAAKAEEERVGWWMRWTAVAATGVGLVGLGLGPWGWVRGRSPVVAGVGMGLCLMALTWQFVLLGMVIGAALVVLMLFLGAVGYMGK